MENRLEKLSHLYFKLARCLICIPFYLHWQPGMRIYLKLVKNFHFYCWRANYTFQIYFLFFTIYNFTAKIPSYLASNQYIPLAMHCLWIGAPGTILINQGTYFFAGEQVTQLVNANVDLIKNLETNHFQSNESFQRSVRLRRILVATLILSILSFFIILIPLFLLFQNGTWQLGSYIYRLILWCIPPESVWYSEYVAMALGVQVDVWHCFTALSAATLNIYASLTFMHTFKITIQQILLRRQKRLPSHQTGKEGGYLKLLQEDILIYSKLRILTTMFNAVYGAFYISPITGALICIGVEGVFIAVRLSDGGHNLFMVLFGFACGLAGVAILILFTVFMAMVNDFSVKFKRAITKGKVVQRRQSYKTERRYGRAVRVEAVTSGSFFQVKKVTCLTVLGMMANVTGSVLLSFKF